MPQIAWKGEYYEFDRSRSGMELGQNVAYRQAMRIVTGGRDIYTYNKEDAYKLAKSIYSIHPEEHFTGEASHFRHYHPGSLHPEYGKHDPMSFGKAREGFGHIFFNLRGG